MYVGQKLILWSSVALCDHVEILLWMILFSLLKWGKDSFFSKWCWPYWTPKRKRLKLEHFLTTYTNISAKWIKDRNVNLKLLKLEKENTGSMLRDISLCHIFFCLKGKGNTASETINVCPKYTDSSRSQKGSFKYPLNFYLQLCFHLHLWLLYVCRYPSIHLNSICVYFSLTVWKTWLWKLIFL